MPKGTFIGFSLEEPDNKKFAIHAATLGVSKSGLAKSVVVNFINGLDKKTAAKFPTKKQP